MKLKYNFMPVFSKISATCLIYKDDSQKTPSGTQIYQTGERGVKEKIP
jgi:hypothetical protein